jgi:acetyl-CoA hydrolase
VPELRPYILALIFQPQLISHPEDRIGKTSIAIDPDRVVAIVESHLPDNTGANAPETAESRAIAGHLIEFLSGEVDAGRLPKSLLPLQSGIGNVANSIIGGLAAGPFDKVMVWTEVLQGIDFNHMVACSEFIVWTFRHLHPVLRFRKA